jgi:uncharacterized protein YbcI
MAVSDGRQRGTSLHAAISDMVVRVTADYTGRGATRARTTINGEWIFVTLTDILTKGEHKLAANGRAHFVRSARRGFQDVMRDDFTTEIQALTGRRVFVLRVVRGPRTEHVVARAELGAHDLALLDPREHLAERKLPRALVLRGRQ